MKTRILSSLVALTFIFSACNKDLINQGDENCLLGGVKSLVGELNAGFDPGGTYMTYGNQGEGYKNDAITTIQVVTTDVPSWNWKTVYNFYLKNSAGEEFVSFCGNYNSAGVGEVGKNGTLESAQKEAIIGALNYINNEFGSVDAWSSVAGELTSTQPEDNTKLIAQFAIWMILDHGFDVQINQPGCEGIVDAAKAAVANPTTGDISLHFLTGNEWPNDIEGTQPQIVPVIEVTPPTVFKGSITIAKTVDGINITVWAKGKKISDLISFNLYSVAGDGEPFGALVANGTVDVAGNIVFTGLDDGWYAIEEVLTAAGKVVFEQPTEVKYILLANGLQYGESNDFNYGAIYSIVNGYGGGYVLGYPGLNNTGDIFPIGVELDAEYYPSFCGNAGSVAFAPDGYMIALKMDRGDAKYADFVKAYNYIENKYGNLDANRAIAQIITWHVLGAIEYPSAEFDAIDWAAVEVGGSTVAGVENANDKVVDVIKNFKYYQGEAKIVDIVYMVGQNYVDDYLNGQPQYVPIYSGKNVFNNISKPVTQSLTQSYGTVTATNAGNVTAILAGLNPKNGNALFDKKAPEDPNKSTPFVVPNSNHFVFAKVTRAELVNGFEIEFLVGNKFEVVGTGFVQLINGKIELTIDNYAQGEFGVIAFNQLPQPNNGNIHSQKEKDLAAFGAVSGFNHDNKTVIPCPTGDTIYLYFHAGALQFYQ